MSMHISIEIDPDASNGVRISIETRSRQRTEEVRDELQEWGLSLGENHSIRELKFSEEGYEESLFALWTITEGTNELWDAIEEIAAQAFVAGVAYSRSGKFPFPVEV